MRTMPDDDYVESVATARVGLVAGGVAAIVSYTWVESGTVQDGVLLLSDGAEAGSAAAIWLDSWHQRPQWMTLAGTVDDHGVIGMAGAYDGGGWRITLVPAADTLRMTMDNVMEGMEYPVVEVACRRPHSG